MRRFVACCFLAVAALVAQHPGRGDLGGAGHNSARGAARARRGCLGLARTTAEQDERDDGGYRHPWEHGADKHSATVTSDPSTIAELGIR